jgi:hypothetical protein
MSKATLAILTVLCVSLALADDFKTIEGKEYKNVTVKRVEPDGLVLSSKSGISKVYFAELPKDVQQRFNYDPEKAAAYSADQNAQLEQARKRQEEAMRQRQENNIAAGNELAARDTANKQQKSIEELQYRYGELQKQETDLERRIEEAEQLPRYLTGQSGRKHYSYLNPVWKDVPEWQRSLKDVLCEKDQVRRQLEQAQH